MFRKPLLVTLSFATLLVAIWAVRSSADRFQEVLVVNLPDVQEVRGDVGVPEPVPHALSVRRSDVIVSPAPSADPEDWIAEGTIRTSGFTHLVLSLAGDVRGRLGSPARVGVLLVPSEDAPRRILREHERAVLGLEVVADLAPGRSWFASEPTRVPVAFPEYDVYFWNDSSNSVTADLHVYLTH